MSDAIAIVGLAARFPGAADAGEFWRNVRDGVESISALTPEDLDAAGVGAAERSDPRYVAAKGVLAGAELFDAAFFGFTPREAEVLDPQHRIFLECAWQALEDAGCDPRRAAGRTGVWAGSGASSYLISNLLPSEASLQALGAFQVLLLNDRDFLATRTSFTLDLKGPSASVQTACSTSLVAVHMACQSLLSGECDQALAGGVSISVPLTAGYLYQEGGTMSPDGHCRSFDAAAAGAVGGNGCGVVVLKRLDDAVESGDRIYAVIRGSAVNNDGADKIGFTAPSISGQAEAIAESLLMSGVEAESIGYVEAHGSGTPLGDPIEIAALTQAFRAAGAAANGYCAVSSVKSNIGHCNTAAGVAGLIKAALALTHRTLPPSLHFTTPNPRIDFAASPFYVPTTARPWPAPPGGAPRRAGVSSFGLGGTNVHVVLEEAPPGSAPGASGEAGEPPERAWQLLPISARTPAALAAAADRLAAHLVAAAPPADPAGLAGLADIAWTLQAGRQAFGFRRAAVARDAAAAAARLAGARGAGMPALPALPATLARSGREVAFLFPGVGDQYVDLGRELYESEAVFRAAVDACAARLTPWLGADLRQVMFSAGAWAGETPAAGAGPDLRALRRRAGGAMEAAEATEAGAAAAGQAAGPARSAEARLRRTLFAQPACFVVGYALARLLMSWGIEPRALIGYSVGELVAACVAGSLPLEQALDLVAQRALLVDRLPEGSMLAIPLDEATVRPLLGDGVDLAATNGPHLCIAAGPAAAIADLARKLAAGGTTSLPMATTHAFHSAMMEPAADGLAQLAGSLLAQPMHAPRIPWISNVTGHWVTGEELVDPAYWSRHMVGTVRFAEGTAELLAEPERVFLEVGAGSLLSTLVKQHPSAAADGIALSTLRRADEGGSDVERLLATVGRLWEAGVDVDWQRFQGTARRRRVGLPGYPFERQRCWIDPPAAASDADEAARTMSAAMAAEGWSAPGEMAEPQSRAAARESIGDWFSVPSWQRRALPAAAENVVGLGRWLVFAGNPAAAGLGERIVALLRGAGHEVATVAMAAPGAGFSAADDGAAFSIDPERAADYEALFERLRDAEGALPSQLLHLWGIGGEPSFAAAQSRGLTSLVLSARAISAAAGDSPIGFTMVADGLADVLDGDVVHAAKTTLLGGLKVIHQEVPRILASAVDVALPISEERLAEQLIAEAGSAAAGGLVALRGSRRFVRVFDATPLAAPAGESAPVGTSLVAGVEHGPGWAIAEQLVRRGGRVAVVLPPELPPRAEWIGDDRVVILHAASGDAGALRAAVGEAARRLGSLRGAFWTGGPVAGGLVQLKTPEMLHAALAPTAADVEALLAGLDDLAGAGGAAGERRFLVLSSTTTAVTGGLGQLELAAAGSYLEGVAAQRAAEDATAASAARVRVVAAHWDPYQWGGWLVAGVGGGLSGAAAEDVVAGLQAHAVGEEVSAEALDRLLASGLPAAVISKQDLAALMAETDSVDAAALLGQMPGAGGARSPRPALATPYEAPRDELEEQLTALWQELFGVEPIGRDDSFLELGGHSLLAIQIVTLVRHRLQAELPVTALFESPTIAQLAQAVRRARGEMDAADLEALLALVEGLSPEEAAERLAGMEV